MSGLEETVLESFERTFTDDSLRILRTIRFFVKLRTLEFNKSDSKWNIDENFWKLLIYKKEVPDYFFNIFTDKVAKSRKFTELKKNEFL